MRTLGIDIETFSSVELNKAGVYKYASAPDFQILLFAYAFDNEKVQVVDIASGEALPDEIFTALTDKNVIKVAFNANFERTCISKYFKLTLPLSSWRCTAAQAAMLGLPQSLEDVAQVLGLKQQKMKEGKDLIRYFSVPCKATKTNGGRERNMPKDAPDKWQLFKAYCGQDVEVERAIRNKLDKYITPGKEAAIYILDQQINDRGVLIDKVLTRQAIDCSKQHKKDTFFEAQRLTGLDNPNSVMQLKEWLRDNGAIVDSLSKKEVTRLSKETEGEVEKLLKLRLQLAKTSIKKYEAIERAICPDGRVRGLLQYYGANRTGRWSGRLVQVQNLPQNKLKDLELARDMVKSGSFEELSLLYDSVPVVLSELIRTAFIPKEGCRFIVADFSAIEARIIAYLANESWVINTFKGSGKLYEMAASKMFNVPIELISKGNPEYELRAKGKVATLACGYQGGVNALIAMGALDMGLKEGELPEIVSAWRQANSNIVKFWYSVEKAAIQAIGKRTTVRLGNLSFSFESGMFFITLPSKRRIAYVKPRLEQDERFDKLSITYEGMEQKSWSRIKTYGGKLTENIVQAIARDILAEAMLSLSQAGYEICMHVHDEVIIEAKKGVGSLTEVCEIMSRTPKWAEGLPLSAAGFECEYYKKE